MPFQVVLTSRALQDLAAACDYIRQFAPATAQRWRILVLESLLQLENNPEQWPLAPESLEFPFELRQFLVSTKSKRANRVLYTIVDNEVRILAIRRPGLPLATEADLK